MEKKSVIIISAIGTVILLLVAALVYLVIRFVVPATTQDPMLTFKDPTVGNVATVNGKTVEGWKYDYYKLYNVGYFEYYGQALNDEYAAMVEEWSFESVINDQLVLLIAEQKDISISEEDIATELETVIASDSFGSQEIYDSWLQEMGYTQQQINNLIKTYLTDDKLYEAFTAETVVTESEAKAAYDENPTNYITRLTSHILIKFNEAGSTPTEEEKKAAYDKAAALIKELDKDPSKFAELAKANSHDNSAADGGLIDYYFTAYEQGFVSEYVEGTFALEKVGSYSKEPVESEFGYHIIMVNDEKTFDNSKEDIMAVLKETKGQTSYGEAMEEQRAAATVKLSSGYKFKYWQDGNNIYK